MIIGFTGGKGYGKSTAAKVLVERDFDLASFATTLKIMLNVLLVDCGISREDIAHYAVAKEQIIPTLGVSYRHLAQTLGTEWGREHVHRDLWIIAARQRLARSFGDVVFDDVRFENEAHMIRAAGGFVVHIRRPERVEDRLNDKHASERALTVMAADKVIMNDCDEAVFRSRVLELLP